jgi:hypothetical protein
MTDRIQHASSQNPWIVGFPAPLGLQTPPGSHARRGSFLAGLRCRLRRGELDRELAAGADPESTECLRRRACELTARSQRAGLAAAYERLLAEASAPPILLRAPVNRGGVRESAPRLAHLATRLREDPDVRAQGVARARVLLTDAAGPLYAPHGGPRFGDAVRSALASL